MKVINKFVSFAVLLLTLTTLFSFSSKESPPDFGSEVYSRFYSYLDNFREEKVYLQTDKPYYSAGENIWFKGYLVNAATQKPESYSNFIYVELIDREDTVVSRVKIQRGSTGFAGHIKLDQTIPAGDYNLIAYSQWMRNNSSDFFFNKKIHIGNRIEEPISFKTTYGELKDGHAEVKIQFVDEHLIPVSDKEVEIAGQWSGSRRRKMSLTTNSQGYVSFDLPIDTANYMPKALDLSLDMEVYTFETKLFLPDFSNDFDVQFFPESGVLLNNAQLQSVAFKAIGADGMSREISGKLYTENGKELLNIESQFNGMGKLLLSPTLGESYYAILKSSDGIEKRFQLPEAENEGVSLQLNFHRGKIYSNLINHLPNKSTQLYLLVHSNGIPFVVAPIVGSTGQLSGSNLGAGINTFSVIDSLGNVYCERLFFKSPSSLPEITMQHNQEVYSKRELVNLTFTVQSKLNKNPEGFYSLSVTDNHFVKQDTINDNIICHLLLSSDIKGYIEKPTSYFTSDSTSNHEKLDLLMMTQGWTRYNTSDLLKGQQEQGDYLLEVGQTLTGSVVNIFGRPVKNRDVYGLVNGSLINTKTDSLGRYVFDGIGFQDSTTFVLRAQKKKGLLDIEIKPDIETFPKLNTHFLTKNNEQQAAQDDYFDQSRLKFLSSGGIRHIYLDEFTVKARKKEPEIKGPSLGIMADIVTSERLDRMRNMSMLNILRTLPGVMVNGTDVTIRNNPGPPLLIVDGVPRHDFSEIEHITTEDVDNIQVLKGATASFYGTRGANGVIAINTKSGEINFARTPISMATITPLGCQRPEQFYVPKYEVQSIKDDETPDLRTTIYWDPHLSPDSLGVIDVEFYTADPSNNYSVVLEGITKEGEICRYEGEISRQQ